MSRIADRYRRACEAPSDINEHLPTLVRLATGLAHVTEFGTRSGVSTCALMYARPGALVCYDLHFRPEAHDLSAEATAERIPHRFVTADVCAVEIEPTELLFIDTRHDADQLRAELALHADRVSRYIVLHDTETFGEYGETPGAPGLLVALGEFLANHPEWMKHLHRPNNNGLTVLVRVDK